MNGNNHFTREFTYDKASITIIKELTHIEDDQEALEHFATVLVEHFKDPQKIIDLLPNINGFVMLNLMVFLKNFYLSDIFYQLNKPHLPI